MLNVSKDDEPSNNVCVVYEIQICKSQSLKIQQGIMSVILYDQRHVSLFFSSLWLLQHQSTNLSQDKNLQISALKPQEWGVFQPKRIYASEFGRSLTEVVSGIIMEMLSRRHADLLIGLVYLLNLNGIRGSLETISKLSLFEKSSAYHTQYLISTLIRNRKRTDSRTEKRG